ncbi:MAG: radical SAM protein [Lachnospira sp.]|nr:radical SAM protein [Lachnospira sp.]
MINRICISTINHCNLACKYCHFHEKSEIKEAQMDIFKILDNVKDYVRVKLEEIGQAEGHQAEEEQAEGNSPRPFFKIGFVGNGEAFLEWDKLKSYIAYLEDSPYISAYTITNGTVNLADADWKFLEEHGINVGFSIDGYKELHNKNRCNSFERAMENVENYRKLTGHYPTFNATVGRDSLENADRVIEFFSPFGVRITFSRMIGKYGISLAEYRDFLKKASKRLELRSGGLDCTMYGGKCGAGTNNYFFANGNVYFCGNCIDLPPVAKSDISFFELEKMSLDFDRNYCYKESL